LAGLHLQARKKQTYYFLQKIVRASDIRVHTRK